jgi:hypothetical protein
MTTIFKNPLIRFFIGAIPILFLISCGKEISLSEDARDNTTQTMTLNNSQVTEVVLLVIDEESIDNGNAPNNFSETDVNDQIATIGQRQSLRYFRENAGDTIDLFTGDVGDEGWHAIKSIPQSWKTTGPVTNGSRNYLQAGPGLGGGNDGPEVLLDKIANVTPLRATGLKMLVGKTVLAVVYDGDVSINYGPLEGSLKGANLGLVALEVIKVTPRTDGSSSSLPRTTVKIVNVDDAKVAALKLFNNAPLPISSSVPFNINPPAAVPAINLVDAL